MSAFGNTIQGASVGVLLAVLMINVGCGKKESAPEQPKPLALVDGVAITEEDYAFEVERRKEAGRPLESPEAILQSLIERQVMLETAAHSEIMQDPAIRRELENKQLGQWLDRSLQVERDSVRVSDEEMEAYYKERLDTFTRPAMARLAILVRRVNARDGEDEETALRNALEKGKAAFMADPAAATQNGRLTGFGTVAAEYSEDTTSRYRGGDLGWMAESDVESRYPAAVIQAGLALEVGAISEVISAEDGLYVVMKTDERPAQLTPYEEVAPTLRRQLIRLKQEEVDRTFRTRLLAGANIEINQERADRLTLPTEVPPDPPALSPLQKFAPHRE